MDETLSRVAVDVSGRPFLVFKVTFARDKIGEFDTELVREWFQAFAMNAGITLHVETLYGDNSHHIAESCFKALARALRIAIAIDPRARRSALDQGYAWRLSVGSSPGWPLILAIELVMNWRCAGIALRSVPAQSRLDDPGPPRAIVLCSCATAFISGRFLFGPLWFLWHRLWLALLAIIVVSVGAVG